MNKGPLCCNCGKPIAKCTRMVLFGMPNERDEQFAGKPVSIDEARKYVSGQVTSVRWSSDRSYISSVNVWDGETYEDDLFCTNRCAIAYARNMARINKRASR